MGDKGIVIEEVPLVYCNERKCWKYKTSTTAIKEVEEEEFRSGKCENVTPSYSITNI